MKDLRRYISKKRSSDGKHWKSDFERDNPATWQFLSYCVYNSFKNEVNRMDALIRLADSGEYFNLTFSERDMYMLEDFGIPTVFVRETILNALLPDYVFRDWEADIVDDGYCSDDEFNFETAKNEVISDLKTFLKANRIPNRRFVRFVKENADVQASFYGFAIRSGRLRKIYSDPVLKDLFECSLSVEFVSPDCVFGLMIYFVETGFEPEYVDVKKTVGFIEACKRSFPNWKRKHRINSAFADQLYYLDEVGPMESLIYGILKAYVSLTEVMF